MKESFKHAVGKSTLKEGFAVPKDAELWMNAPDKGGKRIIWLLFGGYRVPATLRRLDNERAHVQVKYETRDGEPFRNWLVSTFATRPDAGSGEYFELAKVGLDEFEIKAYPAQASLFPHLAVDRWLFHGGADRFLETGTALSEIPAVLRTVEFRNDEGQSHYNRAISASFQDWQWDCERQVIPQLGLKYDFAKDGVQVEVEFGNARTYYQDYIKFLLAHRRQLAQVGVLLVPSEAFAKHLCEIGSQRAREKGRGLYSGMIHFEKVHREFSHLEFMLTMPIAVAGIGTR